MLTVFYINHLLGKQTGVAFKNDLHSLCNNAHFCPHQGINTQLAGYLY